MNNKTIDLKKAGKWLAVLAVLSCVSLPGPAHAVIKGAGASFPARLYYAWAAEYFKKTGVEIDYKPTRSVEGVRLIKEGEVDFGASNTPLSVKELDDSGLFQFPIAVRGVVPVINLPGVEHTIGVDAGRFKLAPDVLADIYMGRITKWNDERIAALNPEIKLPDKKIIVVQRTDESSTTWTFTRYLSKTSKTWRDKVGYGHKVKWPAGIGKETNAGVASYVKSTAYTIGFVEYTYALKKRLSYTRLENRKKVFVEPLLSTFVEAGTRADWKNSPGNSLDITDQDGEKTWPIAGATYILVNRKPSDCESALKLLDFFDWAFKNGSETAENFAYAMLSKDAFKVIESGWSKEIMCNGNAVWKSDSSK